MEQQSECVWCCRPRCRQKCPQCGLVAFCSRSHLKNHLDEATGKCLPFRIRQSESKGRYAEAIRDIEATELILRDRPLVVGPSRQQQIVCVECLQAVDGSLTCDSCNFPVCSEACIENGKWHMSLECPFFVDNGFKAADKGRKAGRQAQTEVPPLLVQLASISPLRLLLQGLKGHPSYQDLEAERPLYGFYCTEAPTSKIRDFEADMTEVMWGTMGMHRYLSSEAVVRTAIGQLFNNAKSLEKPGNDGSGLYGRYCMLNHCCVANAKCIINEGSQGFPLDVRAQTRIVKGEEITTRYVGINIGSPSRADLLRAHWSFTCQCKRCMDPTELKTFSSAIRCNTCGLYDPLSTDSTEGLLLPSGPVPGASSKWACTSCSASMDKAQVEVLLEEGLRIIRNNTSDPPEVKLLEHVIKELTSVFHFKHYLVMQVKFVLFKLLVVQSAKQEMTIFDWIRLTVLSLSLLETLSCLDPGASRNRGKILKDLIKPFMKVAQHKFETGEIDEAAYVARKAVATDFAKDLITCYKFENAKNN